jgi:hypothetical protein
MRASAASGKLSHATAAILLLILLGCFVECCEAKNPNKDWRTRQELNLSKVPINTRKSRYMDTKRDTRIVSLRIPLSKK